MTTDEAREALLEHFAKVGRFARGGVHVSEHVRRVDALITAVRAEYDDDQSEGDDYDRGLRDFDRERAESAQELAALRAFWLAFDTLVASDPQKGYSLERQRGWDEAVASIRSLRALAATPAEDEDEGMRQRWTPRESLDVEVLARAFASIGYPPQKQVPPGYFVHDNERYADLVAAEYARLEAER